MRIFTLEQIKKAEEKAVSLGDSFLSLMERAGKVCAETITAHYNLNAHPEWSIAVVCGRGKNGGDGFVIARIFQEKGIPCKIILASGKPAADDAVIMYEKIKDMEIIDFQKQETQAAKIIDHADLLIDSIVGFGFHGAAKPELAKLLTLMNRAPAKIAAIDLPTGLDCDSGIIAGESIHADLTVAISTLKPAHVTHPAAAFCGTVQTVSIEMPEECFAPYDKEIYTIETNLILQNLKPRKSDANKGSYGKVLSVCGSFQMPGAAVLAATGAVRGGAGLVTCACPHSIAAVIASHIAEPIFLPLPETEEGFLSEKALPSLLNALQKATVCLVGCGMGNRQDTSKIVKELILHAVCPIIIDADGINCLADNIDILKAAKSTLILTPHPGEMARLTGKSIADIQSDRITAAKEFAVQHQLVLILKGAGTIVTNGERVYVNTTGNPGMAKGGSGDALSGIIAALLAQGIPPLDAAACGVFLHGAAGDAAAHCFSQRGMTPTDLLAQLPLLLSQYEQQGDA